MRIIGKLIGNVLWVLSGLPLLAQVSSVHAEPTKAYGSLPLEFNRSVEFTTEEGTWLSLDLSPDGKTIVFELLGDLYTLPVNGGSASLLIGGVSFESQPKFSPDGEWITFVSDRSGAENIWVSSIDSKQLRQITNDHWTRYASPIWTPDGKHLVASRASKGYPGNYELWKFSLGDEAAERLVETDRGSSDAMGPTITADGRYLYYSRRTKSNVRNNAVSDWQLVRVDLLLGKDDLISDSPGGAFRPLVAPGGDFIVYGSRRGGQTGLMIRDLHTGNEEWLRVPVDRDDQESAFTRDLLPGYAFDTDATAIYIAYGGKIRRLTLKMKEERLVPFQALVQKKLGPRLHFSDRLATGRTVRARLIQHPRLSPDGESIAFTAFAQLYIRDELYGEARRLTNCTAWEFQPSWSPDGEWISFVTWSESGGHIWKVAASGNSRPVQLTSVPAYYSSPVWSPDQSRIIALRAATREHLEPQSGRKVPLSLELIQVAADGSQLSVVTTAGDRRRMPPHPALTLQFGAPHFGPEPDRIYYHGPDGLTSLRLNGSDRQVHMQVKGGRSSSYVPTPTNAFDIRLSPNGKWALTLVNDKVYLLEVPPDGQFAEFNLSDPTLLVHLVSPGGADHFEWANSGRTISWSRGSAFYRRSLASVVARITGVDHSTRADASSIVRIDLSVEVPRLRHDHKAVLRGGDVLTMVGDSVIRDADILIAGNRITKVGERGSFSIPNDARIIDIEGKYVLPGFVDVHAHRNEVRRGVLDQTNSGVFLSNLAYGITTGLNSNSDTVDLLGYGDLVEAGKILGPRILTPGPAIRTNHDFDSLESTRQFVAGYKLDLDLDHLKPFYVGNRRQRQWMAMAARTFNLTPTTEVPGDMKLALTQVTDGFVSSEHALPLYPLFKDVIEFLGRAEIFYNPMVLVADGGPHGINRFYIDTDWQSEVKLQRFMPPAALQAHRIRREWVPSEEYIDRYMAHDAAKLARAGAKISVGSAARLHGLDYHWELWALHADGNGLSNMDVLRSATVHGATSAGYGLDIGTIEPGKLADLIVLDADPRADIRNSNSVIYVMKNGNLFAANSLEQVWPLEVRAPKLYWH